MKLKKVNKSKNKLLQLQILKLYHKKKSYNFETKLKRIEIHLNKISNIIYKYHITNKKILFVGFPNNFNKIIKNTRHMLIPESNWHNGMLSNRITTQTKKLKIPSNMLQVKKKPDLIVIYNLNKKSTAIKESYHTRIPAITFSKKLNLLNILPSYNSIGNYNLINEKAENNNFIFSFIKTSLYRAKITKKDTDYKSLNQLKKFYIIEPQWNF